MNWIVIVRRCWLSPIVCLLSACSPPPIASTPAIAPPPIMEPSALATSIVEMQTLRAVGAARVATPTLKPSVDEPTVAPTAVGPTATPPASETPIPIDPTISAAHGAQIMALEVTPERVNPGDTITLHWQAQGERATLCPDTRYGLFRSRDCVAVPVSGTQAFVIPSDVKGNKYIEYVLTVAGASGSSATRVVYVAVYCPQYWFFTAEPQAWYCPQDIVRTPAAIQYFERGMMIWLKEPGRYFIMENRYVAPGDIRRPLSTLADPLNVTRNTEASAMPPAGLFAPISGFGMIWRGDVQQSSGFRDRLGWALQPEFAYEAAYQCDDATPSGGRVWQTCYLTAPDGQILATLSTGAWYWRAEQVDQAIPKAPRILTFTAARAEARPGDMITLSWTSMNGATATLLEPVCCTYAPSTPTTQPLNRNLSFVLQTGVERDTFTYTLVVSNDQGSDSRSIRVRLPCADRYFFASARDDLECPATAPIASPAAEQLFERGRMIWLASQGSIYVLWGDGQPTAPGAPPDGFLVFEDTWQPGEAERDPASAPPSGLYQPVRGFGKVWRTWPEVRDGLGWALAPEHAFDGVYQRDWKTCLLQDGDGSFRSCSGPSNDFQYLRAADGRTIRLMQFAVLGRHSVQQWEFWAP